MSQWRDLVSTALLGTERRTATGAGPLPLQRDAAEEQLLALAAVETVYRRAGAQPIDGLHPLEPAPAETLPRCAPGAAWLLEVMLGGEHASVLDEWLALALARGVRAPEELLAALLAAAQGRQEAVLAVAGERGRWLGAIDAAYALPEDAESWTVGTLEDRRAALRRWRRDDAEAAREALAAAWPREDARARAALLAELRTGLSPADEPFLESALDDRRQEVRAMAADLLARLPDSAFRQRMAERAAPLLRLTRSPRARLEASLPAQLDAAAARDVAVVKPPSGAGERAWWLEQILAAAPLELWERMRRTPRALARLPVADGLAGTVHAGWALAAARQESAAWAAALLPVTWDARLVAALPPAEAERRVAASLDDPRALAALGALARPYGLELSRELARRNLLHHDLGLAVDPRVFHDLPDEASPAVRNLLAFRHDLHEELG